jgi:hypothetical protein
MEDQNDLARSAAQALKANVVTGGKAELAAQRSSRSGSTYKFLLLLLS